MRYSAPGFFTQTRPAWVGDLGTIGQKVQKVYGFGL
jgi:hypothetical protein